MGLCCCRSVCDDEEPARQPLINRGSRRHESSIIPVFGQPQRRRPSTTFPFRATPADSWISAVPERNSRPNPVLGQSRRLSPQPDTLRSNITDEQPERKTIIDGTSRRYASRSAHVFKQPIVKTSSIPSSQQLSKRTDQTCAYGTFTTPPPSKHINKEVNHWPPVRSCCNEELLAELLRSFQTHHLPVIPKFTAYELEALDKKSKVFVRKSLFRNKRFREIYKICSVKRIWNPYLMLQYMLNKWKYADKLMEYHMYHGTNMIAAHSIMAENFNWRMVKEFTCGKGIYFANNPFLASHYGKKRGRILDEFYIMIVAKVLIEEGEIERGLPHVLPAAGHSTTSKSKQEVVKFDDSFFYPEFLVCYKPINTET